MATVVGVRFSSLAPQRKTGYQMVSGLSLWCSYEKENRNLNGTVRRTVPATSSKTGCNINLRHSRKCSDSPLPPANLQDHLSALSQTQQHRIEIKMRLAGGKPPNQRKHWFAPQFAAQPQMQRFSSPARQFAGSAFGICPKRSSIESKLKRNRPVIAWGCSSPSVKFSGNYCIFF